jgi:hypothetical protein
VREDNLDYGTNREILQDNHFYSKSDNEAPDLNVSKDYNKTTRVRIQPSTTSHKKIDMNSRNSFKTRPQLANNDATIVGAFSI